MNANESTDVELEEGKRSLEAPAKSKRGRPKKPEGIKLPKTVRRNIFAEAFGDRRAAVAAKAIKSGSKSDFKALVAAVRAQVSATVKSKKLEDRKSALFVKMNKIQKKVEAVEADLQKIAGSSAVLDSFRPRIASLIETIYVIKDKPVPPAVVEAPAAPIVLI